MPARDLQELVTYAKAWPGKVSFGTPGAGTPAHLATELLKQEAGIDLFHVPYKGMPASVIGHVNGEVALMITPLEMARPHMTSGKLRALATAGAQRVSGLPDLPTVAELGYPGFSLDLWYALLAPAGTPPAIVNRLNAEMAQLLRETETREALKRQGIEVTGGTPNELAALIRDELAKWKKVVVSAKIRLEE